MLRPTFVLLFGLVPLVCGQLIIGFCPPLHNYVKNLDFEKYSGTWYVVAQSRFHPMQALNCQRETYAVKRNGLSVTFNTSKKYEHQQKYKNGTLKQEGDNKGEMKLSLNEYKLDILEREKEKAKKIYGNQPNGLWWLEFRLDRNRIEKRWSLKSRFRGTLKEASEKNNALRRLKPRFEGSIN
ncbi:hypothetical protein AVEN_24796-1 [Araneus ventricosus]|uniref:Uncharacterized protein n=1 Tax=Araneus ventricosus TaxID=182803 RepID=A0A4Y2BTM4_ARAVE|nr:hypothetical protein AVEN_24796-1 [Araneus ventricosus]